MVAQEKALSSRLRGRYIGAVSLAGVLAEIRACRACAGELPHEPRPVVRVGAETRMLICGQAPGRRVHESGLPFDDPLRIAPARDHVQGV